MGIMNHLTERHVQLVIMLLLIPDVPTSSPGTAGRLCWFSPHGATAP